MTRTQVTLIMFGLLVLAAFLFKDATPLIGVPKRKGFLAHYADTLYWLKQHAG